MRYSVIELSKLDIIKDENHLQQVSTLIVMCNIRNKNNLILCKKQNLLIFKCFKIYEPTFYGLSCKYIDCTKLRLRNTEILVCRVRVSVCDYDMYVVCVYESLCATTIKNNHRGVYSL